MHGSVDAVAAIVSVYVSERRGWRGAKQFCAGVGGGDIDSCVVNQAWLSPMASTIAMLVPMPVMLIGVFLWSEASMRRWLGDKLDKDIEVMNMISRGELHNTRPGAYLRSLRDSFPAEVRADMLCLMQLTIELSARAKGELLLREAGMEMPPDPEIEARFQELAYLQKSIGRTGLLAVAPLLSQTPRDLWEMRRLARGH